MLFSDLGLAIYLTFTVFLSLVKWEKVITNLSVWNKYFNFRLVRKEIGNANEYALFSYFLCNVLIKVNPLNGNTRRDFFSFYIYVWLSFGVCFEINSGFNLLKMERQKKRPSKIKRKYINLRKEKDNVKQSDPYVYFV